MDNFRGDRFVDQASGSIDHKSKARYTGASDDFFAHAVGFCLVNGERREQRPDNADEYTKNIA
ncbi:hypothetical protein R2103_03480 [Nitrosomonas sp. Is24]|uniref:hypothetical protein n=1 Tax=Nitrosomonas sp. Is24 TaxID=3080533 RepID=UPI00294AB40C|nr:hypothetical protein [Nitrosomonas sp. Is24]MDV6340829.1 hypothetical protein [Nitrosomonas sp. Is24]